MGIHLYYPRTTTVWTTDRPSTYVKAAVSAGSTGLKQGPLELKVCMRHRGTSCWASHMYILCVHVNFNALLHAPLPSFTQMSGCGGCRHSLLRGFSGGPVNLIHISGDYILFCKVNGEKNWPLMTKKEKYGWGKSPQGCFPSSQYFFSIANMSFWLNFTFLKIMKMKKMKTNWNEAIFLAAFGF